MNCVKTGPRPIATSVFVVSHDIKPANENRINVIAFAESNSHFTSEYLAIGSFAQTGGLNPARARAASSRITQPLA